MARMEFLRSNRYDTTTQIVPPSGTESAGNLMDRTVTKSWESVGQTGTSRVLSIVFSQPTPISHLILQGHNLEKYRVFYNSATANSFPNDVNVDSNTSENSYHYLGTTTVSSIQIQMDTPFTTTAEYTIGELIATERLYVLERNPSAAEWKPKEARKRIIHDMPDGGVRVFNIKTKYATEIGLKFITESAKDSLFDIYDAAQEFIFVPFPTTTGWDGKAPECSWLSDFDFKPGTNDKEQGFSGTIKMRETPSG